MKREHEKYHRLWISVLDSLISHGVDINTLDNEGRSLLEMVIPEDVPLKIFRAVLKYKPHPYVYDAKGGSHHVMEELTNTRTNLEKEKKWAQPSQPPIQNPFLKRMCINNGWQTESEENFDNLVKQSNDQEKKYKVLCTYQEKTIVIEED